jgi:hypothetical protein
VRQLVAAGSLWPPFVGANKLKPILFVGANDRKTQRTSKKVYKAHCGLGRQDSLHNCVAPPNLFF